MSLIVPAGAWTPAKAEAFRSAFMEFLQHVRINSKDLGGDTVLADHIYTAQKMFLDCIFEGLKQDIHDFKILKSRQLGISTMSRALSIFWLGMHKGLKGSMVFDTQTHRDEARNEIMTMINDLPAGLGFPTIKKDSRDLLVLSNDSDLRFLNAGVRKSKSSGTLGRSSGLNFGHNSEMCSWENEEGLESYKNALSETYPDRLYIWESTARGFNMWFRMWQEAKADNLNQKTCFIGWWGKDNQRIAYGTPSFDKYGLPEPTEIEKSKIREVEQLYGVRVDREQLAWYRRKTDPAQNDEMETTLDNETVIQEQPWTESESFIQSGSTFFSGDRLTEISKTDATDKYDAYSFLPSLTFFDCDWRATASKSATQLKVWEEPQEGGVYVLAADPAYGHDEENNYSAVQVLRCYADCVEQVAEYASASTETQPFAWVIASLAGWYKNATLILELNGPGEAVWNEYKSLKQLVLSGYMSKIAKDKGLRDIFVNVRDYMFSRSDSMGVGSVYHWKMQEQLKVAIMERLRDFVRNGTLIIRSFDVLEEMKAVVRKGDSIKAENRNRDDRTICFAMGIRCWEQAVRKGLSAAGRTKEHEVVTRRMSIKDQIGLFNKHTLDKLLKSNASSRARVESQNRRTSWRNK